MNGEIISCAHQYIYVHGGMLCLGKGMMNGVIIPRDHQYTCMVACRVLVKD